MTAISAPPAVPDVDGDAPLEQSRLLRTAVPGPRSLALTARRAQVVPPAVGSAVPVWAARAGGGVVEDVDGNRLVDLGAGIAVTSVGVSHPDVVAAVAAQAAAFTHTCFMVTPYEPYVAVAEALARLTPGDHAKRSVLVTSGAEAVENAVKVARRATGRDAVLVLDHAYHGRTNLTMAMTARAMPYKAGFGPFAGEVYRVPASYPLRDPVGMTGEEAAARLVDVATRQVGADRVAALVAEPVLGEGGFVVPAPGFWPALARWCAEHGVVLVADEVQTGFARTGAMFALEHEGVVPDLVTTAKGIAGGLPLAAATGRAELMDAVHPGGLGGTYGGNPVACAAALAAIEVYERDDLAAAARRIEAQVRGRLEPLVGTVPGVAEVRGRGAMLAVELVEPGDGLVPDRAAAARVAAACAAAGVIVLTCGTWGNVVRLLPPLVIDPALLDDALDVLVAALRGQEPPPAPGEASATTLAGSRPGPAVGGGRDA
ncbi:4-aminobutyrate--2-oxoglutarate transaminase [Cellulomonas marina]|uniref:(S)-3-amino-2-methylpropionate transaminase n=1 Tax=Cellulomonas marina TaxID=988821 RepID=A0A1I0VG74_9CELL|nr:4-aminobutyrate--2-oxoglutarate transaminase [Cellulomonas marina]GIG27985.1 4-aminobutyrate aminotransferase GabT [Cellulomonas marina]SFA75364.1 4-aminobutyrate aminotransferase / (S)-3-amino-2-methylpropionate transaminase [Cellulomonas marina]